MKGLMQFCKKGKLSPQYVSLYSVLIRVGNIAYELDLYSSLSFIHPVFHIFMLRRCMGDFSQVIYVKNISILDFLGFGPFKFPVFSVVYR